MKSLIRPRSRETAVKLSKTNHPTVLYNWKEIAKVPFLYVNHHFSIQVYNTHHASVTFSYVSNNMPSWDMITMHICPILTENTCVPGMLLFQYCTHLNIYDSKAPPDHWGGGKSIYLLILSFKFVERLKNTRLARAACKQCMLICHRTADCWGGFHRQRGHTRELCAVLC